MADPKKVQKRRFVRLDIVLPVKYRRYTGNPVFQANFNVGRTINLSVGGVKLSVSTPIPSGTNLDMEIEISDSIKPYVVGKVVGGEERVIEGISRRIEKIGFVEVDKDAQDLMMKYIFENLRKVVRKDK